MGPELHDALSAFQFGAFLELPSKDPNPHAGGTVTDQPQSRQSQTPETSDTSSPGPSRLHAYGRQAPRRVELAQDDRLFHLGPKSQPDIQRAERQPTPPQLEIPVAL